MEERKYKCAVTGENCPYEADVEGCKPCRNCKIGKEFLEDYTPLHDEI